MTANARNHPLDIAVLNRHANVEQDVLAIFMVKDLTAYFPALFVQVELEEVVEASYAGASVTVRSNAT